MPELVKVAKVSDIPVGEGRAFSVRGERIAVFNVDGDFYAIDDTCTHDAASLSQGWLEDDVIECPLHGARFNVRTGAVLSMPAVVGVRSYSVKVEGEDVFVEVE